MEKKQNSFLKVEVWLPLEVPKEWDLEGVKDVVRVGNTGK